MYLPVPEFLFNLTCFFPVHKPGGGIFFTNISIETYITHSNTCFNLDEDKYEQKIHMMLSMLLLRHKDILAEDGSVSFRPVSR